MIETEINFYFIFHSEINGEKMFNAAAKMVTGKSPMED